MHILHLPRRVVLGPKQEVEPGVWVLDDTNAAQLLVRANGGIMTPYHYQSPGLNPEVDYNGKTIFFQRAGGFGDLMLLAPVLREVKRRWPTCRIVISTMTHYSYALKNLPYIDEIVGYPVSLDFVEKCDAKVFLERAIEGNPRARELHMTDLFGELTGIGFDFEDKKPDFRLTELEKGWASICYPRTPNTPRLIVQVGASAYARTFPPPLQQQVLAPLFQKGWEVCFVGKPGEVDIKGTDERIKNLTASNLTFRQSCAVLNTADVVFAPDSAMVHVSAALDVPCVAVYGPFPWQLRTKYSPSVMPISGQGGCAPCFHHAWLENHFPDGGPCNEKGMCTVLAGIPVDRITLKIQQHARRQPVVLPDATSEPKA